MPHSTSNNILPTQDTLLGRMVGRWVGRSGGCMYSVEVQDGTYLVARSDGVGRFCG